MGLDRFDREAIAESQALQSAKKRDGFIRYKTSAKYRYRQQVIEDAKSDNGWRRLVVKTIESEG